MSVRRTAILAVLFVLLGGWFVLFEGLSVEPPPPGDRAAEETILPCPPAGVATLRVSGRRGVLVAERRADAWRLSPRPDLERPAELAVESLVTALCELPVIDAIAEPGSLADFGLETPPAEVEAGSAHWRMTLRLGDLTPAGNLLYARRGDESRVLKVGALLRSEVDKVLAFAGPATAGAVPPQPEAAAVTSDGAEP